MNAEPQAIDDFWKVTNGLTAWAWKLVQCPSCKRMRSAGSYVEGPFRYTKCRKCRGGK